MINWLFLNAYPLYKPLYYNYKRISDRRLISWMKGYLNKGMVAVDIGANIGFYTELLSDIVGDRGKVYSFEPDEANFRYLENNVGDRKNVILQKSAVGDRNGIIDLYLSDKFNTDHHTYKNEEARTTKKIKSVSLDKFFGSSEHIDFIKSDIQGFDYFATKGASQLIRRQKEIAIIGEFWPYGLRKAGVNPQEYINLLKSMKLNVTLYLPESLNILETKKEYYTDFIAYK